MPHANMSHWQSLQRNRPVEYQPARSVEELAEAGRHRDEQLTHLLEDLPEVGQFHEHVVMRSGGDTPTAEIYVPEGDGPFPVFLHIHGGAWFTGSARSERRYCMWIATQGYVVVNIDYALAPKRPFPKGSRTACTPRAGSPATSSATAAIRCACRSAARPRVAT